MLLYIFYLLFHVGTGLTRQETKAELLLELENRLKLAEAAEESARTELQNLCQYGSFYFRRSAMQRY